MLGVAARRLPNCKQLCVQARSECDRGHDQRFCGQGNHVGPLVRGNRMVFAQHGHQRLARRDRGLRVANVRRMCAHGPREARLVDDVVRGRSALPEARVAMTRVEHEGDDKRAELISELSRCLTTPIDREDIFRLSRSVDDVLDNLRDFLREAELFEPVDLEPFRRVLPPILDALTCLRTASAALVKLSSEISLQTLAARKASNAIRREYELVLADLFADPTAAEVLKQEPVSLDGI